MDSCSMTSSPMSSDQPSPEYFAAAERAIRWQAEFERRAAARDARIQEIVRYARSKGLDANPAMVFRHLKWFEAWFTGYLATGYLMGRTGIKWIVKPENKQGG